MRVSKKTAAKNRKRILTSAARLFRENGIGATGVDAITEDAGLTHGGLYSQFGSKEAIAAEAIRFALARSKRVWQRALERNPGKRALPAIVDGYLSRAHRDAPGTGCVVAALGTDIARQPRRVRQAFTREIKDDLEFLSRLMPNGDHSRSYEDAIVAFASMAGALILARAVNDEALSDLILKSTAKRVTRRGKVRAGTRRS
ncbi:MAG TPA: TetR/AcrR family transcriptional regulator [Candidatus Binatus sp.]|uniref:TetR/AcrR family transcriptional regulator n=1 Tax=Candidatus Binatus sp. TaxID=2811406 RepID=UPI002F3F32F6